MKPEEALQLLDQVAATYKGTRKEHSVLAQALEVLKQKITKQSKKPDKK